MNREKLDKTRNHAILKTEKPLGTRLERSRGVTRRRRGGDSLARKLQTTTTTTFILYCMRVKKNIE